MNYFIRVFEVDFETNQEEYDDYEVSEECLKKIMELVRNDKLEED